MFNLLLVYFFPAFAIQPSPLGVVTVQTRNTLVEIMNFDLTQTPQSESISTLSVGNLNLQAAFDNTNFHCQDLFTFQVKAGVPFGTNLYIVNDQATDTFLDVCGAAPCTDTTTGTGDALNLVVLSTTQNRVPLAQDWKLLATTGLPNLKYGDVVTIQSTTDNSYLQVCSGSPSTCADSNVVTGVDPRTWVIQKDATVGEIQYDIHTFQIVDQATGLYLEACGSDSTSCGTYHVGLSATAITQWKLLAV